MPELGKRLKALREGELDLTTRALSDALAKRGVAAEAGTISRYEGGRAPTLAFVVGLSMLLDSTVDYVLNPDAPKRLEARPAELEALKEIAAIVDRVRATSPDEAAAHEEARRLAIEQERKKGGQREPGAA